MQKLIIYGAVVVIIIGGFWFASSRESANINASIASPSGEPSPSESAPIITPSQTPKPEAGQPVAESSTNKKTMQATLNTNKGNITIEFYEKETPKTVANFVKLAKAGFYNGVKFHRVIKDFMIQSGDPLTKDDSQKDLWGTGGPGDSFEDEIGATNKNNIGTIAMANSGQNTNGSQFFINVANNNFLGTKHTVFGKVISGMDVVNTIQNTPTDANDRPTDPVVINSITIK